MSHHSFKHKKNRLIRKCRKWIICALFDHPKNLTEFQPDSVKKVLCFRDDDKIGDMVISTALFHVFAQHGITVDVLAGPSNACVIQHSPDVRHIHIIHSKKQKYQLARQLKAEHYDLIINTDESVDIDAMLVVHLARPKHALSSYKSFRLFDLPLPIFNHNSHITNQYRAIAHYLGIQNYQAQYLISIPDSTQEDIRTFLLNQGIHQFIAINPFGTNASHCLSPQQFQEIVDFLALNYPKHPLLCIGKPGSLDSLNSPHIIKCQFPSFLHTAELIKHADLVISPDTSIVHVAAAFHKNLVSLYRYAVDGNPLQYVIWGPGYPNSIQVLSPAVPDFHVQDIPIQEITNAIMTIFPIR